MSKLTPPKKNWEGIPIPSKKEGELPVHLIQGMWSQAFAGDDPLSMRILMQHEMYPTPRWVDTLCFEAFVQSKKKTFRFLLKFPSFQERLQKSCKECIQSNVHRLFNAVCAYDNQKDLTPSDFKRLNLLLPYVLGENPPLDRNGYNFAMLLASHVFSHLPANPNWRAWFEQDQVVSHLLTTNEQGLNFFDFTRNRVALGYGRYTKEECEAVLNTLESKAHALLLKKTLPEASTSKSTLRL